METLVAMVVLATSVSGSFELLRLADLSARHTAVDNRITELIREYNDFVLYVAYDQLPEDGDVLGQGNLYQIYDEISKTTSGFYQFNVTASVETFNRGTPTEYKEITLTINYQADKIAFSPQPVSRKIVCDAITRPKP